MSKNLKKPLFKATSWTSGMIKHALVSGEHNSFKPALLKLEAGLAIIIFFAIAVFGLKQVSTVLVSKQSFLGEVYPAVVATLTNNGRQATDSRRLKPLNYNSVLEAAALRKADDMVAKGYFAHNSPDGKEPWDWIREAGYGYEYAGENLAINFADSIDVYQAWMNSPSHRANILNPHYTEIGIGARKTNVNGRESIIVVQMFASPSKVYQAKREQDRNRELARANSATTTIKTQASTSTLSSVFSTSSNTNGANQVPVVLGAQGTTSTSSTFAVLGASTSEEVQNNQTSKVIIGSMATNPKIIGLTLYVFFIVLINIAVIGLGRAQYHHNHKKSIFIAVFMLSLLSILSIYFFVKSPEVILA